MVNGEDGVTSAVACCWASLNCSSSKACFLFDSSASARNLSNSIFCDVGCRISAESFDMELETRRSALELTAGWIGWVDCCAASCFFTSSSAALPASNTPEIVSTCECADVELFPIASISRLTSFSPLNKLFAATSANRDFQRMIASCFSKSPSRSLAIKISML